MSQYSQTVWNTLLSAGATPQQAAGIMGNMQFESGINPESAGMDTNGYMSYGLVQWNAGSHAAASSLVTGNPPVDIQRQIAYLVATGGLAAAAGTDPQGCAENFAHIYERCAECGYQGSSQLGPRAQAAQQIFDQAQAGNWNQSPTQANTTAAAPQQGATPAAPAGQSGPFSPQDQARMVYMGTLATYGPEILDPSSPTFTEWNSQGGNATLTGKGSSIWGDMWNGFFGAVFPGATIAGGSGGIGGVIGGAETAAGVFAWLMKPTNLLRLAEIVAGAGILAVGGAMYIQILVPSVGGVIGVLAGGPGGRVVRGVQTGRAQARAEAGRTQRTLISEHYGTLRHATQQQNETVRSAERYYLGETGRTQRHQISQEHQTQRHAETESQRSYRTSQRKTTRHATGTNPGRITRRGGKSYNEAGEELFA